MGHGMEHGEYAHPKATYLPTLSAAVARSWALYRRDGEPLWPIVISSSIDLPYRAARVVGRDSRLEI